MTIGGGTSGVPPERTASTTTTPRGVGNHNVPSRARSADGWPPPVVSLTFMPVVGVEHLHVEGGLPSSAPALEAGGITRNSPLVELSQSCSEVVLDDTVNGVAWKPVGARESMPRPVGVAADEPLAGAHPQAAVAPFHDVIDAGVGEPGGDDLPAPGRPSMRPQPVVADADPEHAAPVDVQGADVPGRQHRARRGCGRPAGLDGPLPAKGQ